MTDQEYEMFQAKIVELQNDDYSSKPAAELQAWLGEQVLADYLESGGVVEGEICDTFWLDE